MRALVISDSHGRDNMITKVLETVKNYDAVIFLGDGEKDIYTPANSELIQFKKLVAVQGNCDFGSSLPVEEILELGSKKIFCLHGHSQAVKFGMGTLVHKSEALGVDVTVHGHTHQQHCEYENGIWYMCPGAVKAGEYGIIDIDDKTDTVLCYTKNIYF